MHARAYARRLSFCCAALALSFATTSALAEEGSPKSYKKTGYYQSYSYYGRSTADLVVRPDVIVVDFSLTKTSEDPEAGLGAIQAYVDELKTRYQAASKSAEVEVRNLSVRPPAEKQTPPLQTVTVSGAIELPLAAGWDYWKRAQLLVSLVQLAKTVAAEQKDARKAILATIGVPTALVKNPEEFRFELIRLWLDHVRSFTIWAQTPAAPLEIQQCDPPGKVNQQPVSLEEVALMLQINCRVDLAKTK